MSSVYAVLSSRIVGVPLVNGMVCDTPMLPGIRRRALIRAKLTFPFSNVVVGNSMAGLKAYGASSRKRACIHNGFDMARLDDLEQPEVVRERLDIRERHVVGMVASFVPEKDYETFLGAAEILLARRNDTCFLSIGDGASMNRIRNMVPVNHRSRVRFLGRQERIESLINVFTVSVLSSLSEGFPNVLLEAMALGKPVIASDVGGIPELISDGVNGFLVPPRDPASLAEHISTILDNTGLARAIGSHAREHVNNHLDLETMVTKYISVYSSLMHDAD